MLKMRRNLANKLNTEACMDFLRYKKARNVAEKTISYYEEKVSRFIDWMAEEEEIILHEIDSKTIDEYSIYLQSNYNLNDISINTHLRGVRAFIYYCQKFDYYCNKFKVELIETTEKTKDTYTLAEIKILLRKPDTRRCTQNELQFFI